MTEHIDIAGYCRISVDEELDRDNVSIENQKRSSPTLSNIAFRTVH